MSTIVKRGERKQLYKGDDSVGLTGLIFQNIDDKFSYGQYGEFDIVIKRRNGHVNATKLCDDYGRNFEKMYNDEDFLELVREFSKIKKVPVKLLIRDIQTGQKLTSGIYVHPILVPHISSLCSARFAAKMSSIISEAMA